jgi:hypothetical protein
VAITDVTGPGGFNDDKSGFGSEMQPVKPRIRRQETGVRRQEIGDRRQL